MWMKRCVLLAIMLPGAVQADDGDLVAGFGEDGIARLGIEDAYGAEASNPVVGADGTITYCATRGVAGDGDMVVVRVEADGTPDTSFSSDGRFTLDFGGNDDTCAAVVIQADGRIVVAGATQDDTARNFALARFHPSGTLDTTFGTGGRQQVQFDVFGASNSEARAIAVQPNGRLLVAGNMSVTGVTRQMAVARLLPDGSYDSSFNGIGRQRVQGIGDVATDYSRAHAIALDASGRILLAGQASKYTNDILETDFAAARLLPDGSLDGTFGDGGHTTVGFDFGGDIGSNTDVAHALRWIPDGRIVLAGEADVSATATPNMDMAFVRLLADGTPDAAFGTNGRTLVEFDRSPSGYDVARALVLDGAHIVAAGYAHTDDSTGADLAFVRLLPNATRDPSFGNFGRRTIDLGFTDPGIQVIGGLVRAGSHLLFSGLLLAAADAPDAFVGALESDTLFAYGME
jgi:uncharacterized delta-60 repeat protein